MDYYRFPRRREAYDHKQKLYQGQSDEQWWEKWEELKVEVEAELESYFVERYGQSLGSAAARFANLYTLPPDVEEVERQKVIEQVEMAMAASKDTEAKHPVLAVFEAVELRTDRNYAKPEHRSNRTQIKQSFFEDLENETAEIVTPNQSAT